MIWCLCSPYLRNLVSFYMDARLAKIRAVLDNRRIGPVTRRRKMVFSRIVTLLAGALVSAVVMRWKDDKSTEANAPWRAELEALQKKLMVNLDERDAGLAARIGEIQPRLEE